MDLEENEDGTVMLPILLTTGRTVRIRAWQIGRVAVPTDSYIHSKWGETVPIQHINSSKSMAFASSFDDAVAIADELSRWAKEDMSGTTDDEVVKQIGPDVVQWLRSCHRNRKYTPYREWFATRRSFGKEPTLPKIKEEQWPR